MKDLRAKIAEGFDVKVLLFALVGAIVIYLVFVPLFILLLGSLKATDPDVPSPLTFDNYIRAYSDEQTYRLLASSFIFAFGTAFFAFAIGATLAWLVERTNTPLSNLLRTLYLIPLMIPGVIMAIAWTFLLDPRMGLINTTLMNLFGLDKAPLNIYSMWGMIFVQGLGLAILPFLMMSAAFRGMDPAHEEAASMSGANVVKTLRHITIRLMLPALIASLLMLVILGLSVFEVPIIIGISAGIPVFSTKIYLSLDVYPTAFGMAATLGVILLLLSSIGILLYQKATARAERFGTITGKGYRPRLIDLGGFKYIGASFIIIYLLLAIGLPTATLFWGSLLPYFSVPSSESISKISLDNYLIVLKMSSVGLAVKNSLILAMVAPAVALLIGSIVSWIVIRTQIAGRKALDIISFIPYAIPGIVVGQAVMYAYLRIPLPIYGTLWILLLAMVTKYIAFSTRIMNSSLLQIHRELEEAAQLSGASWAETFTRITIPLLKPAIISTWLFYFVFTLRDLSIPVLLYTPDTLVLPIVILENFNGGDVEVVCALAVMIIIPVIGIVLIGRRFLSQVGIMR